MAKTIDQLSIFVENKAGSLVRITRILADAQVDIRAMSLADTADFGILRLIVNRTAAAVEALSNSGCIVAVNEVIAVLIPDEPGGLSSVLSLLADNSLFIEYSYAFITRRNNKACVVFRVEDNAKAQTVLESAGIALAGADELFDL